MYDLLRGLRVVEASAFVAAPSCALYLAQLGRQDGRGQEIRIPLSDLAITARQWSGLLAALGLQARIEARSVCWAPYQTLQQAVSTDRYLSAANPMLSLIDHPSGQRYLAPGAAASLPSEPRRAPAAAHRLGQDTDEVLAELLDLSPGEIGRLHDLGVVGGS